MWSFKTRADEITDKIKIDADAAAILRSASFAADAILRRRAAMDKIGLKDKPLVVIAGEAHDRSSHHLHHMVLVSQLKKEDSLVLTGEYPHNGLTKAFEAATGSLITPFAQSLLDAMDRIENLSPKSIVANYNYVEAHVSRAAFMRMVVRQDIAFRATDTSNYRAPVGILNPGGSSFVNGGDSESTEKSLKHYFNKAGYRPGTRTSDGVAARNHHMATMGLDFAREKNARILFQQCGDAHTFGDGPNGKYHITNSLAGQYQALRAPFIAVPLYFNLPYDSFMQKHGIKPEEILPTMALPDNRFTLSMIEDPFFFDRWFGWDNQSILQKEMDYINPMMERIGLPGETMTMADYHVLMARYTSDTISVFKAIAASPHNTI